MLSDKEILKHGYLSTGKQDINGVTIFEGSIIDADDYHSDIENQYMHSVHYDPETQEFYTDIYTDSDSLSMYNKIVVVGHSLEFLDMEDANLVRQPVMVGINELETKYSGADKNISDLMWEFIKSKGLRYEWDRYFNKHN